ncbi:MAG: protecting protein DprA [Oscillospiraceae bacterium]|jgi:DNA processing protein|nr:protecting protein DprA [Oscillospiraceae bacterium]
MADLRHWIWLSEAIPKGDEATNKIISEYEDIEQFYNLRENDFDGVDFLTDTQKKTAKATSMERAEQIISDCERLEITILTQDDERFPNRLKTIFGTPPVIYAWGNIDDIDECPSIAVVGTRNASDYGKTVTGNLCYELANVGMTIISGCAVGIDEYAHRGALKANGRTLAVLGCGLDVNYPLKNAALKKEILKNGALISELPPGTGVTGRYFPIRNRLMAGLAVSVLITEAPERSGALITAEHALQQGKEIFCVNPLVYGNPKYAGVVKYLRDGAIAVYHPSDILLQYYLSYAHKLDVEKILNSIKDQKQVSYTELKVSDEKSTYNKNADSERKHERQKPNLPDGLDENALRVYEVLDFEPIHIEEISLKTGLSMDKLLSVLTELEIVGVVSSYSGRRFGLADNENEN